MAYNHEEAREEYLERMRAEGNVVSIPEEDELQIDIDTEEQYVRFCALYEIFEREMKCSVHGGGINRHETPSRSGLPNRHIRIHLPFNVGPAERIAWQAALGSDPTRELLSLFRVLRGESDPTMLIEQPGWNA